MAPGSSHAWSGFHCQNKSPQQSDCKKANRSITFGCINSLSRWWAAPWGATQTTFLNDQWMAIIALPGDYVCEAELGLVQVAQVSQTQPLQHLDHALVIHVVLWWIWERKERKKTRLFCIRQGLKDQKSALATPPPLETPTPSHKLDLEHCEGKLTWVILQLLLCFLDSDQNALCQFRPFANDGEAIPNVYHFLSWGKCILDLNTTF